MQTMVRTVYGIYLQNCVLTGQPFKVIPNTTLNEKLNINASEKIKSNTYPQLKYFCIGNGGHECKLVDGIFATSPKQHIATDASPFKMTPFVLRELSDDLTDIDRQKYGLRRIESYNGKQYIAYYLRRIDYTHSTVDMKLISVDNKKVTTVVDFVPNASNLNPVPQVINPHGVNVLQGKSIDVTTNINLMFDAKDAEELRNVSNVMHGTEDLAIVSEIGLVSGLDFNTNVSTPGLGNFQMKEVIAAQVNHITCTNHSAVVENLGFNISFGLGENASLWLLEPNIP